MMEFVCVLSAYGTLVSYNVKQISTNKFNAKLKGQISNKPEKLPDVIEIYQDNGQWKADPPENEVVGGIIRCIESN